MPQLSLDEVAVLLESLEYSKMRVRDAQGTPYEVRQQNLAKLDGAQSKVRAIREAIRGAAGK